MSLELRSVTYSYPGQSRPVIDSVSLSIARGESLAVMGPSGAGKSTLLSVAGLLLRPTSGEVLIDEVPAAMGPRSAALGPDVSWILQTVSLLPRRTVLDNVALPALARGVRRYEAYAEGTRLLELVGCAETRFRPARTLSGGQAQRVGVARALMVQPAVLLADEPTANLDLATARDVARCIIEATKGRTALVLATHDPEVARLADRTLQLHEMRIDTVAGRT